MEEKQIKQINLGNMMSRLKGMCQSLERLPNCIQRVCAMVEQAVQEGTLTDADKIEIFDRLDACSVGIELLPGEPKTTLEAAARLLEDDVTRAIRCRSEEARNRTLAMMEEDIEEELDYDKRIVDICLPDRVISREHAQHKRSQQARKAALLRYGRQHIKSKQ